MASDETTRLLPSPEDEQPCDRGESETRGSISGGTGLAIFIAYLGSSTPALSQTIADTSRCIFGQYR